MSFSPCQCKERLRAAAEAIGFCAVGVTQASPTEEADVLAYDAWIAAGCHAEMGYLERYSEVRSDPALLLDGARSVVSCAVAYDFGVRSPHIASYALGRDYHEVVRDMLMRLGAEIEALWEGAQWRACVDTAPVRERLLAVRAGVGFIGRNRQLIVPGVGSRVFLGELVTTAAIEPDEPCGRQCAGCGACERACPGGALRRGEPFDARRCLSYLTIEHRGPWPADAPSPGCRIYGCDVCQDVCPENSSRCLSASANAPAELLPRPEVVALTPERAAALTQDEFSRLFSHSAVKRTRLEGLVRNASTALAQSAASAPGKALPRNT